jgi:hypothetical protein
MTLLCKRRAFSLVGLRLAARNRSGRMQLANVKFVTEKKM